MIDDATRSEFRDAIRRALEPYPETLGVTKGAKVTVEAVRQLFAVARDNGWLSLATPEEQGGLGLGMEGAAVLAVEIGRAAAPGPFLGNAVLLPMLARIPGGEPFATCLDAVLAGERLATIGVSAGFDGDARVLVEHAAGATDVILVGDSSAGGKVRLAQKPAFLDLEAFDPVAPMASLAAGNEPDTGLTPGADAAASLFGAADLWIAAELLGIAERSGEMAVAHAGERRQFGQIIGSYQGIKHRIVDDYVLQQNAAAVLQLATRAWDAGQADRRMLAHAARFAASEAALSASAFCIQAHGAMGFSWEHPAHLYYKRARRLANLLGSAGESRAALGEAICAA